MRKSQITLLGAVGAVLVGIVVLAVAARVALSSFASGDDASSAVAAEAPRDAVTRAADLTGFDGILIRDSWDLDVVQGDEWRVELSVPEETQDELRVRVEDGRLILDGERRRSGWWNWWGADDAYRADVVVPDLSSLTVEGSANIELSGFDGDDLSITASGAVNMHGRDSRFEGLSLTVSGASNIDLEQVPVVDAHVELSGASNVVLAMDGGRLTGELSGFGNVTYTGSVSAEDVQVSGFGRVGR